MSLNEIDKAINLVESELGREHPLVAKYLIKKAEILV